jgi:hypothetical protein
MDEETIRIIDGKWPSLKAGPLLPSPSEYYRRLEDPGKAVASERS